MGNPICNKNLDSDKDHGNVSCFRPLCWLKQRGLCAFEETVSEIDNRAQHNLAVKVFILQFFCEIILQRPKLLTVVWVAQKLWNHVGWGSDRWTWQSIKNCACPSTARVTVKILVAIPFARDLIAHAFTNWNGISLIPSSCKTLLHWLKFEKWIPFWQNFFSGLLGLFWVTKLWGTRNQTQKMKAAYLSHVIIVVVIVDRGWGGHPLRTPMLNSCTRRTLCRGNWPTWLPPWSNLVSGKYWHWWLTAWGLHVISKAVSSRWLRRSQVPLFWSKWA